MRKAITPHERLPPTCTRLCFPHIRSSILAHARPVQVYSLDVQTFSYRLLKLKYLCNIIHTLQYYTYGYFVAFFYLRVCIRISGLESVVLRDLYSAKVATLSRTRNNI